MRVEKILASYGLTLDEVADLLEIPAFKEIKEARSKAQSSDNLAFQLATLDDKLAEYLRTEEVKEILEANKKEAVEEDEGSDFDDIFGEAGDSFWESLGVDADDESARVRVQTEVSGESSPPVVMPSEEEEKKDEFYVKTFSDVGIGTFLTILGEGETPQVDDSGNVFFSRDELHFKAFMDEDAKSFRQIALNGQKVTMQVFSENQDIVQEAVFEGQNPQVIVKSKDDIQFRELSDVSSIYDTENSLNFTKPFSMVEARTLVTAMNGSKADLTKFVLPLGIAIDPNLTQKSNYVFSPKTMYDLADCEEFFKVSVGGYGYITNYCEGNELQHLQFFELAGSAHLNVPYEKGAKSTITLSTIVNKQFNANMQKVLDAPVQENEPLTLVGFAPALPSQVPYADVDLLSEQAGYFVFFHKDAGRAIYLPAIIGNYFRKYYGEDVTFNIGMQSGPNGEMVIVFKSEDDIVGFHIVQREHAPVTQVARLLIQNQTDFMHDVQTEFASAFENKIDLEQAMGVETKYTFKDEVFEEIVKKPKKARKSKPKTKKKAVKKGKSEAEQIQDIIDELREIILLFDVTDDAEEIAEIEGEIEVLNDIREELISEEADDPMELDEEELTEDEEMVKDILESPEPQDIEEMAEVTDAITIPTPSGMDMEAMVEAEDDDDDLFSDLFEDDDLGTPEPEDVLSPDTIAEEGNADETSVKKEELLDEIERDFKTSFPSSLKAMQTEVERFSNEFKDGVSLSTRYLGKWYVPEEEAEEAEGGDYDFEQLSRESEEKFYDIFKDWVEKKSWAKDVNFGTYTSEKNYIYFEVTLDKDKFAKGGAVPPRKTSIKKIMDGVRGSNGGPFTIIAFKDGKLLAQRSRRYPEEIPLVVEAIRKLFQNAKIEVEDGGGQIIYQSTPTRERSFAKGGKTDDVDALAKQTLKKWWEYYDEMDGKRRREKELAFKEFKKANKVNVKNDYYTAEVFVNGEAVGFAHLVTDRTQEPLKRIKYVSYGYAKGGRTNPTKHIKVYYTEDNGYGHLESEEVIESSKNVEEVREKWKSIMIGNPDIQGYQIVEVKADGSERKVPSKFHGFAKGGVLDKEFKFDKNFVIYVPSTSNVGDKISSSEMGERVSEVEELVANEFGGFTKTETDGGYKASSGDIVEEDIVKVSVFSTDEAWEKNEKRLIRAIKIWAKEWGQEAIGFEYEGDLYYIDAKGKMAKGGKTQGEVEIILTDDDLGYYSILHRGKFIEKEFTSLKEAEDWARANNYTYKESFAKGGSVKAKVAKFMATDPSEEETEKFYMREVLPHDKRSISEIMAEEEFAKGGQLNTEIQKIVDAMTDKEVAEKVTNLIFSSLDSLEGDMTASQAYDYALENIEDAREHLVELADAMDLKDELK